MVPERGGTRHARRYGRLSARVPRRGPGERPRYRTVTEGPRVPRSAALPTQPTRRPGKAGRALWGAVAQPWAATFLQSRARQQATPPESDPPFHPFLFSLLHPQGRARAPHPPAPSDPPAGVPPHDADKDKLPTLPRRIGWRRSPEGSGTTRRSFSPLSGHRASAGRGTRLGPPARWGRSGPKSGSRSPPCTNRPRHPATPTSSSP
jgi:hypothetical protein